MLKIDDDRWTVPASQKSIDLLETLDFWGKTGRGDLFSHDVGSFRLLGLKLPL